MLFNKEIKAVSDTDMVSPVDGEIFPVEEVSDSIFAEQIMGQTIAIRPCMKTMSLRSPVNGMLEVLYPSGHAFAVRMADGTGLLVHIGVDTVELNGKGFKQLVTQGNYVTAGQPIVKVNFKEIAKAGYEISVMIIITDQPVCKKIAFKQRQVIHVLDKITHE